MHTLLRRIAALLLLLPLAATAAPAGSTKLLWVAGDHVGGALEWREDAKGQVDSTYAYLDNGRGPKLKARWQAGADGVPVRLQVSGTETYGATINERFARKGNTASWQTANDRGQAAVGGRTAGYLPLVTPPDYYAALVAAALKAGGRLALLPAGEMAVQKIETLTLTGSAAPAEATLYAVTGIGLTPDYVWLDADGRLFASVYALEGATGLIRDGFHAAARQLAERQTAAEAGLLTQLASRSRHTYDAPFAIRNVGVFDSRTGTVSAPKTVVVFDGRISTILPADVPLPKDAYVVDGTGRTVVPALIDMHAHEYNWGGALQVAGGVTTIRDIGNDHANILEQDRKYAAHEWLGPRVWRAGFMDGKSPFSSRGSMVVASLQEALDGVDFFATHGYRQIKIYNSFDPAWVEPVAKRAHELGLRVSGHVPAFTLARNVVEQGYDELQHINMLMLNFVAKPNEDTRTLARFYMVGERAWALDLDSAPVQDFIALLKARNVAVDPTMATFEDMFTQEPGQVTPSLAAVRDLLPVALQRGLLQTEASLTPAQLERFRGSYAKMLDMLVRLDRAGIPLLPGTDGFEGVLLHRELELWVKAGIAPGRVLQHATLGSARVLKLEHEIGAIEPGYSADLILVDGNPVQDISAIRRISLVLKAGDAYFPAEIYPALGMRPMVPAATVVAPAAAQ